MEIVIGFGVVATIATIVGVIYIFTLPRVELVLPVNKLSNNLVLDVSSRHESYITELKDYLTVTNPKALFYIKRGQPVPADCLPITLKLYKEAKGQIVFPRALLQHLKHDVSGKAAYLGKMSDVTDLRTRGNRKLDLEYTFAPRPGQEEAVAEVVKRITEKDSVGGVLDAPTGSGKTYMSIVIACRLNMPTLIIAPNIALLEQFEESILALAPTAKIGKIRAKKNDTGDDFDFVLTTPQTLIRRKLGVDVVDSFGLVIYDEAHCYGNPSEWFKVMQMFRPKYNLGVTATVGRSDGLEKVFQAHIGPVLHRMSVKPMLADIYFLSHEIEDTDLIKIRGHENQQKLLKWIARDDNYLPSIASVALKAANKGRQVVVFCEWTAHIEKIAKHLPEDTFEIFSGSVKKKELTGKPILLASYGKFAKGVDIPRLDFGILATPRSSVIQPLGRIIRSHPGKPTPVMYDYYLKGSSISGSQSIKRLSDYNKAGHNVKNIPT